VNRDLLSVLIMANIRARSIFNFQKVDSRHFLARQVYLTFIRHSRYSMSLSLPVKCRRAPRSLCCEW